jgi:hypothetical protein
VEDAVAAHKGAYKVVEHMAAGTWEEAYRVCVVDKGEPASMGDTKDSGIVARVAYKSSLWRRPRWHMW